jgi:hypothetical protein
LIAVVSLTTSLPAKGFGTFASKLQNGFVAVRICFVPMSREETNLRATHPLRRSPAGSIAIMSGFVTV